MSALFARAYPPSARYCVACRPDSLAILNKTNHHTGSTPMLLELDLNLAPLISKARMIASFTHSMMWITPMKPDYTTRSSRGQKDPFVSVQGASSVFSSIFLFYLYLALFSFHPHILNKHIPPDRAMIHQLLINWLLPNTHFHKRKKKHMPILLRDSSIL